jgi:hypothetical protein
LPAYSPELNPMEIIGDLDERRCGRAVRRNSQKPADAAEYIISHSDFPPADVRGGMSPTKA